MSLKIGSALVGMSLAACLATAGAISAPSTAHAQKVIDCSSLDVNSQAWVNCARKKNQESDVQKHEDECDRGGCGPKAKIQKKVDKQSKGNTWQALDADDDK